MWVRIGPCQTENRKLESFKGSRDVDGNKENIENEEKMEENFFVLQLNETQIETNQENYCVRTYWINK